MVRFSEHVQDVLAAWLEWEQRGGAALVVVTAVDGGGVRAAGAMMAVSAGGDRSGYISGGCLDADVALQAQASISDGLPRKLRYGAGSPFVDLPLPCGGAIEVTILPAADAEILRSWHDQLAARQMATIAFMASGDVFADAPLGAEFTFHHAPKMRLRIAGRGADVLALARLAQASGIETELQMRVPDLPAGGDASGGVAVPLVSPNALPPVPDDPWTAFVLAFHDSEWEDALLKQALTGPAFFIGAVGSKRTQTRRRERLIAEGVRAEQIMRIHGPVGLIPSMRDASMLALSILAEIAAIWRVRQTPPSTAHDRSDLTAD
ncbi:XdhC family protein [Brucella sp. BE17]|uniref:XdhC family protein n=1 Tax=Brucella sp. BE17 TaxID=3142977 RepID=UPI0031BBCC33